MVKKVLYLFLLTLLVMIFFNLSSLNIPSDKSRYDQSKTYFSETEKEFGLAKYEQNDIGIGMISYNNDMILLKDVQPAFELLISEMEKAEKNINMEFYTIQNDQTGEQFKNVLIKKAKQGIEVRLLYDAWGSGLTPMSYFNDLRENGVKVAPYNPLLSGFLQGRLHNRLHHKMIIIDGKKAFIGGENIGDEYLGKNSKIGFWKDTGIIFSGDAALSIQQVFLNDWLQSSNEKVMDKNFYPRNPDIANKTVTIIPGGPDSSLTDMSLPYIKLINNAKEKIFIVTPYFFPNAAILEALYKAAERNIEIHLILPSKTDNKIAQIIEPLYINKLLDHGIKVSTYNRGFIHSKIMIIDNHVASVGSANLEKLSFSKNYEVIGIIYDKEIIHQLQNDFLDNLKDSTTHLPTSK
ncbi:MAG: cardiolipin synthase [Syntrophomonas sp.]|nr:cardiolipin synthase [Syntrophomonas sp.]